MASQWLTGRAVREAARGGVGAAGRGSCCSVPRPSLTRCVCMSAAGHSQSSPQPRPAGAARHSAARCHPHHRPLLAASRARPTTTYRWTPRGQLSVRRSAAAPVPAPALSSGGMH